METLTLNVTDTSLMPMLRDLIGRIKGVSIAPKQKTYEHVLSREEGEQLVRETLLPAYRDVREARRTGKKFPDISELWDQLD